MRTITLCAAICVGVTGLPAYGTFVLLDDFDRINSTNMGTNWTEQVADFRIEDHAARPTVMTGPGNPLMTFDAPTLLGSEDAIGVEVASGDASVWRYIALVLCYADNSNNVFIKLQDNAASGEFNRLYFKFGNNGDNDAAWSDMTGGAASINIEPTSHARIRAAVNGDEVTVQIDGDMNGTWEQTFVRGGLPTGSLGHGIGLGGMGNAIADNFGGYIDEFPIPEPATASLLLAAGLIVFSKRTPGTTSC